MIFEQFESQARLCGKFWVYLPCIGNNLEDVFVKTENIESSISSCLLHLNTMG